MLKTKVRRKLPGSPLVKHPFNTSFGLRGVAEPGSQTDVVQSGAMKVGCAELRKPEQHRRHGTEKGVAPKGRLLLNMCLPYKQPKSVLLWYHVALQKKASHTHVTSSLMGDSVTQEWQALIGSHPTKTAEAFNAAIAFAWTAVQVPGAPEPA